LAALDKRGDSRIIPVSNMHLKSPVAVRRRSAAKAVRAFTILEILVVIAILGMLAGLVITNIGGANESAKVDIAGLFVKSSIKVPLQQYSIHMGDYPSTAEGLQALITAPANRADRWRGPYIEGSKFPEDPWGRPYQYRNPGTHNKNGYDIFSFGKDGVENENDIGNW
jgi:general secretion pathway protein G